MNNTVMIAVQALEKRSAELKQKEQQIAVLESRVEPLELQRIILSRLPFRKALATI